MLNGCHRHPTSTRRPDGLCRTCVKRARDLTKRRAERASRVVDPLPPATCTVKTEAHRPYAIEVRGEITHEGWEQIGDALAAKIEQPLIQIDLLDVHHARSMSPRVGSYLRAFARSGARVVIYASRYVQACLCASRWSCEAAVEWRLP